MDKMKRICRLLAEHDGDIEEDEKMTDPYDPMYMIDAYGYEERENEEETFNEP